MSPSPDPFALRFYAGIGSRDTPADVCARMSTLAAELEMLGFVLRSGGAEGADTAFEEGVHDERWKRIYLPWSGFNERKGITVGAIPTLRAIAMRHHPNWAACSRGAQAMHTRNVAQVLGYHPEEQRSEFVVCWTPRGLGGGGTGQALRVARAYDVRVFDLAIPGTELLLRDHVTSITQNGQNTR